MKLDLTAFKNALGSLDLALTKERDEFIRDSVIQRAEAAASIGQYDLLKSEKEAARQLTLGEL